MFTARDMFIADKGRLVVSLFSLYNIADGNGEKFNQGELLRWLGESVWFPTNLLPSERLNWIPIDSHTAKMTFTYNGLTVFYIVSFNDIGEITQVETKQFMGVENLETWIGKLSVMVPKIVGSFSKIIVFISKSTRRGSELCWRATRQQ